MDNTKQAYLCLDVGTHAVKAAVIGPQGIIKSVTQPIKLNYTQVGNTTHIEQNPNDIVKALIQTIQCLGSLLNKIENAAIACQRSTVMAWNKKTGQALSPAISWQDRRGLEKIKNLSSEQKQAIVKITGLPPSAHYGASKLELLYNKYRNNKDVGAGPLVSWLIYQIQSPDNKCWLCDESNALRTQLWDWQKSHWSPYLLRLFNCPIAHLPIVKPTISPYGFLDKDTLKLKGKIEIQAVCGDQNSAYYGVINSNVNLPLLKTNTAKQAHSSKQKNTKQYRQALVNIGTGAFILSHSGKYERYELKKIGLPHETTNITGLLNGLIYSDDTYITTCYEGGVNGAGSALTYYLNNDSDFTSEHELFSNLECYHLNEQQSILTSQTPLLFFNCIGGLGAPWWQAQIPECESRFYNLNLKRVDQSMCSKKDKAIAVIESIVFMLYTIIEKLPRPDYLIITGGLAKVSILIHRLSQLCQVPILVPEENQLTLIGTACLASKQEYKPQLTGKWSYPSPLQDINLKQHYDCYHKLYNQILSEQKNDKNSRS